MPLRRRAGTPECGTDDGAGPGCDPGCRELPVLIRTETSVVRGELVTPYENGFLQWCYRSSSSVHSASRNC